MPKKGKKISQTQAEVRWAQGSLTDKWEPEQLGWASGSYGEDRGKSLEAQPAPPLLCLCFCPYALRPQLYGQLVSVGLPAQRQLQKTGFLRES